MYPSYQSTYTPFPYNQTVVKPPSSNVQWVQGEASAKSFPVGNGQSVLLMDSEDSVFYIKSTDQSGMPMPLRIFDYTERKSEKHEGASVAKNDYVSREEFNAFKEDISNLKIVRDWLPSTRYTISSLPRKMHMSRYAS